MDEQDYKKREDIFSKPVRAGKRTYFFDVKATRANDYYLTITESKRRIDEGGKFHYDKHKLFLYKEDFEKFADGLSEALDFIRAEKGDDFGVVPREDYTETEKKESTTTKSDDSYSSDVSFDDLADEKE